MGQEQSSMLSPGEVGHLREIANFTPAELQRLSQQFSRIDLDQSGSLSLDEFRAIPGLGDNPLLQRLVSIFDKNKDTTVDFREFIEGFATFFGDDKDAKMRYAFQVYDEDGDGVISNGDLFSVLKPMVGTNLTDIQLQQVVDKTMLRADKDRDGVISFDEFVEFANNSLDSLDRQFTMNFEDEALMFGKEEAKDEAEGDSSQEAAGDSSQDEDGF